MPAADRSLDAIFRQERPDLEQIRSMARQLVESLSHVHDQSLVHGDVKMLNALRIRSKIRLIDMDSACIVPDYRDDYLSAENYCGAKFSSGVLPPEMFVELDTVEKRNSVEKYWSVEREISPELWAKVKPLEFRSRYFAVRSFSVKKTEKGKYAVRDADALKDCYELVPADPSIDIWSFGVLLFNLCSKNPLIAVNRDEDIVGGVSMRQLVDWTDHDLSRLVDNQVRDPVASALLKKLLRVDPRERLSFPLVLGHPFFKFSSRSTPDQSETLLQLLKEQKETMKLVQAIDQRVKAIDDRSILIADMAEGVFNQIRRTELVLLRGMFEATEVSSPTCFIILNQKLPNPQTAEENEKSSKKGFSERKKQATKWLGKLASLFSTVSEGLDAGVVGSLDFSGMFKSKDPFYFYLVDELTMEPVVPDEDDETYPIQIDTPAAFVPKVLPLMRVSLKAMGCVNTLSKLGRCFGFPTPVIPEDLMDKANDAVGLLDKSSSVAEYSMLQDAVFGSEKGREKKNTVRGGPLRELENFYTKYDEKNTFSGLYRVVTPEGICCWTSAANRDAFKLSRA